MISFALVRPTYATAHDRIVLFVIVIGSSMLSTVNIFLLLILYWPSLSTSFYTPKPSKVNKWNRTINDLCTQVTKWSLVKANAIRGAVDGECGID